MKSMLRGVLIFSALGPLIGGLVFWLWTTLPRMLNPVDITWSFGIYWHLKGFVAIIFLSYIFGVVPAAITGFVAGAYRSKLTSPMMYLLLGFVAATISFICSTLMLGWGWEQVQREIDANRFDQIFSMEILPAFISGTVLAILFSPRRAQ